MRYPHLRLNSCKKMAVNMTAQPKERFDKQIYVNPLEPKLNTLSRSTNDFDIK